MTSQGATEMGCPEYGSSVVTRDRAEVKELLHLGLYEKAEVAILNKPPKPRERGDQQGAEASTCRGRSASEVTTFAGQRGV